MEGDLFKGIHLHVFSSLHEKFNFSVTKVRRKFELSDDGLCKPKHVGTINVVF